MKEAIKRTQSLAERKQVYAIIILLDRYYRMNFDIREAIPDWWDRGAVERKESDQEDCFNKDKDSVTLAFSSRLSALEAFWEKVEPFAYENAERIRMEIAMELENSHKPVS